MAFLFQKKNSKYWQAAFVNKDGKRLNRSTKIEAKYSTRREAQRIADAFEDAGCRATTIRQLKTTMAELQQAISGEKLLCLTLEEQCSNWIASKKGEITTKTFDKYSADVRKFLGFMGDKAKIDINEVRKADLISYRTSLIDKVSAKTINGKLKVLRMVFNQAEEEGLLIENPVKFVKNLRRQEPPVEKSVFTLEQLNQLMEFADEEWQSMIMFGYYTGQRLGDIAKLQWRQVDVQDGKVHLLTSKTSNRLKICMHDDLIEFLKQRPAPISGSLYVHPNLHQRVVNAGGMTGTLSNQFTKMLEHLGMRPKTTHAKAKNGRDVKRTQTALSFHSLRHTLVTRMHEAGVPPAAVEQFVGHECTAINRVYTHIGDQALRDAANALPKLA